MFFSGSLQEGIALAVQESKAVICFVQDDGDTSATWQEEYFEGDEEFTSLLEARSVLLRITKDSPEAGFLAPVCPVSQYPTVVVIRNGMLREYIVPNISRDEFRSRLTAVMDDSKPQTQVAAPLTAQQTSLQQQTGDPPQRRPEPEISTPTTATVTARASSSREQPSQNAGGNPPSEKKTSVIKSSSKGSRSGPAQAPRKQQEEPKPSQSTVKKREPQEEETNKETRFSQAHYVAEPAHGSRANRPVASGPPTQYRLQVRLFDGRSVRETFLPSHTVRKDLRPWIDSQMEEKRPYNLKHILTPLPNHTLTIAEEDQPLREIIAGSTATFVMVPIRSYIEAYSDSGSLPVRALSSVYGLVSSVIGTTTGYVASLLGYSQTEAAHPQRESSQPTEPQPLNESPRRRPFGSNIRTLRDQQNEQDRSQLYNGNQVSHCYCAGI
ncbi:uncharacterized protein BJX67DRAFT_357086 [Aspergillus lucknowensis]|uniref:UBX domain-containing protein 2 n=1 Tax=Aspergillus lucknowensis TaxID=176173 RepID=A0ABR4LNA7_9EURO